MPAASLPRLVLPALTLIASVGVPPAGAAARPEKPFVATTPWLLFPVDLYDFNALTSRYGSRRLRGRANFHGGLDLSAPAGTWVVAAREGTISEVGYGRRSGWYVKVTHPQGWQTVYCHLQQDPRSVGVRVGAPTRARQVLGRVGSTGRSTGPHLHFGLFDPRGHARDPTPHLMTPAETLRLVQAGGGS